MGVKISIEEYNEAVEGSLGWCPLCEEFTRDGTDPDAENYDCFMCDENSVMGAELALVSEMFTLVGDED
jgi:hypothetical protein